MSAQASPAIVACLTLALGGIACGGSSPERDAPVTSPVDPTTAASLGGTVRFEGTPPPVETIRLDGDATCVTLNGTSERQTETYVVGSGGAMQNVFVYVKDGISGLSFPVPTTPVELDQEKCRYVPRVLGIQVGQPLSIRNSDPLLHNVRADSEINQRFNLGQPLPMVSTRTFTTREVMVPFKCDVHAWMNAWIGVLDHPFYAVTDEGGRFSLSGLPPGTYTIEAWHEKLGTQTQQVTLGAQDGKEISFTFRAGGSQHTRLEGSAGARPLPLLKGPPSTASRGRTAAALMTAG